MSIISDSALEQKPEAQLVKQLRLISVIVSILVICLGSSVILGWFFDVTFLKSVLANRVTTKVSTALGLILAGISLLLWHQQPKKNSSLVAFGLYLLPSIAIAFSLITLIEYGFNLDLGTSWLSLPDSPDAVDAVVRGRMSPNTATGFLLWNTAILFLIGRHYLTSQLLVILVLAIASTSLIGHIYNIIIFYSVGSPTGMAIPTAIGFILVSFALLATRAERGWMRIITREQAGGVMARWLLPLVIILPIFLGWLFWWWFGSEPQLWIFIVGFRISIEIFILALVVWWTAKKLNQSDRAQQQLFQNLLETERRFHAIFDQTFQFIGLLTPDGILLEANQTALDFGGINKSDVVGKPFWEAYWWRISPETQLELQKAIATAQTGEFVRYRVEVQGANQKVVTIDFSLRPIKNERGEVILLIPEGRDISQQVAIEKALQESEARYRAIVEDQTELICRYSADATILFVNDAYCRYFGLDKEQIIGHQYVPVIYEADRERVEQLVNTMNQNNPTVTIENRVWVKGKVRWTQWNNRVIYSEAGKISEYQSVGRDITKIKEIEAKLKESEERFRRAFEDAATGEALVAPDGKFIKVNRSLCEMIGYSETELLNKTFQEITHPDDLNLDLRYIRQMLAGEIRTYQMEKRYFHQRGHLVWVLLSVSLVKDINNQPLYFISQIQDIDRRKQAEAKLKELIKELERSNRELEEFASVVSHDLVAPLRQQNLFIELLQEEYSDILNEEGKEYLTRMVGLNSRMKSLILNLLSYARVTTQAQPFTPVILNEVVDNVLHDLETEIAQTKAKIKVGELSTIQGDRLQIRQLFQNLLQNALKFHHPNRTPEIKIDRLPPVKTIKKRSQPHFIRLVVEDNGIGFEPDQQEKIFTPFHRLHSYSKYQGTGLGLAICDKIVQRHQGTITAQSKPGLGAKFIICLPVD